MLTHIGDQVGIAIEKIRMYEETTRSEEKLRLTFDSVTQGIIVTDLEGRIVEVNKAAARMYGFEDADELIGINTCELIIEDDHEKVRENMQRTLANSPVGTLEYRFLKKDGSEFPGNMNIAIMKDTSGDAVGFVATTRDISRRKQTEKEWRELEQRAQLASRLASIGQMASGVAHEINNPVASIVGFADLLLERDIPGDVRDDVNVIHSEAERVASIVSKLLAFARRREPEMEHVNINDVLQTSIAIRLHELETNNIRITTLFDPDLPWTMADSNQLQQVFINLIINAEIELKQVKRNGNLSIKTETEDGNIRISFTDNGNGIPEENIERIFEPFFTTRKKDEGTGLGLSVCHGIMVDHKGRITARNEPDGGATFIVELPVVEGVRQLEIPTSITEETAPMITANILVVDDEPYILKFLCRTLENQGYNVDGVHDAKEVLLKLRNGEYDLILLDIKLPGINGIELYRHMQKREPSMAKKVVFITGDIMGGDTRNFLSRTKAHYIVKPFSASRLRKEVNGILSARVKTEVHN
jgi:PAS domain S-box-containing protein